METRNDYKPIRHSPIKIDARPIETRRHNGFEVVLDYDNESEKKENAPAIVDLCHMTKWDIQDRDLSRIKPMGFDIPEAPGDCIIHDNRIHIFRLNPSQAGVWLIHTGELVETDDACFNHPAFTDITDGQALLAVVGHSVPSFVETITKMDLMSPRREPPFIAQGPIIDIASRVVVRRLAQENSVVLFSFPRGYGQPMLEALLDSGSRRGVHFAGEKAFFR